VVHGCGLAGVADEALLGPGEEGVERRRDDEHRGDGEDEMDPDLRQLMAREAVGDQRVDEGADQPQTRDGDRKCCEEAPGPPDGRPLLGAGRGHVPSGGLCLPSPERPRQDPQGEEDGRQREDAAVEPETPRLPVEEDQCRDPERDRHQEDHRRPGCRPSLPAC
jgi:hypothetical protein